MLSQIRSPAMRLRSINITLQFDERIDRLSTHVAAVRDACNQVRSSTQFRQIMSYILRIGNYLNCLSTRGGAYGFKLADLEKLRQVRSADLSTSLLHYVAKSPLVGGTSGIKDLKMRQLPAGVCCAPGETPLSYPRDVLVVCWQRARARACVRGSPGALSKCCVCASGLPRCSPRRTEPDRERDERRACGPTAAVPDGAGNCKQPEQADRRGRRRGVGCQGVDAQEPQRPK